MRHLVVLLSVLAVVLSQRDINDGERAPFQRPRRPQFGPPLGSQRVRPQVIRPRPFQRPSERLDEVPQEETGFQPILNRPNRPQFARPPVQTPPVERVDEAEPRPQPQPAPQLVPIVRPVRQDVAPSTEAAPVEASANSFGPNQPPSLVQGRDLLFFSLPENTPVGTVVYTLEAKDPEGSKVVYTISGDYFSINKDTGAIT
jgi:hypothetical protein